MRRRAIALAALLWLAGASAAHGQQAPPDPHAGHKPASSPPAPAPAAPDAAPTAQSPEALPPFIRPLTDADRAAAFPQGVHGHSVHDDVVHAYVLFDELEWRAGDHASGLHWDVDGWIGRDRDRLWLRAEGVSDDGRLDEAHAHVLYGRPIARWWDAVAGVRQDVRPGAAQTWAAAGVQGFAPYRVDVEITGYLGGDWRSQLRLDAAHDVRVARRVVAQTRLEATINGKADRDRLAGAGLAAIEAGLRIRYEVRRDLAPYLGVTWKRSTFESADLARAAGERPGGTQLTVGLRVWR